MKKGKLGTRVLALGVSAVMATSVLCTGWVGTVNANYAPGDAPFINTWLVAGPAEDSIYGDDVGSIKRPVDGNWAKVSEVTANSSVEGKIGGFYAGAKHAIDGVLSTMWATNPNDGVENKQLTLTWTQDIQVKRLEVFGAVAGAPDSVSPANVNVELFDRAGKSLGSVDLKDLKDTTNDPVGYDFDTAVEGVAKMVITPTAAEGDSDKYVCISTLRAFDGVEDSGDAGEPPAGVKPLTGITATANSTCSEGGIDASKAIDGDLDTAWKSRTHQMVAWDNNATLTLTLENAALVTNLNFTPHEDKGENKFTTVYQLLNSNKEVLKEGTIQCSGAKDDLKEIAFGSGVKGVKYVTLSFEQIDGGLNHFGIREVEVIGLDTMQELTGITATANSTCSEGGIDASKAIDGDLDTAWKSRTHQMVVWDRNATLTLTLDKPALVTNLNFTPHEEKGQNKFTTVYQLLNSRKEVIKEGSVECSGSKDDLKEIALSAEGVKYVTFSFEEIDGGLNHFGIREVSLFGMESEDSELEKVINVTPKIGDAFGDTGSSWQYFDDRIFNRATDDYNDLYGYFDIKQGVDTKGKNVYAHTYVYSPKDQKAELRFASPSPCKVFFNDAQLMVKSQNSSDNLGKDDIRVDVDLKQGWNKLLFELYNAPDAYILGLYARFCTPSGDDGKAGARIEGLQYSVMGGETSDNELTVVTQGLDIDKAAFQERNKDLPQNQYPENELPNAYTQWPYVWNEEIIDKGWDRTAQASKFQFQAAGGAPGYTWEIEEGTLPPGLTLNEDGTIDGVLTEETGEYPFTVKVTDADGNTATKDTKIIVKVRPNKWLEEGGMSALSHCIGSYNLEIDSNYSADTWAERAKNAGMTMVAIEAAFQTYYWPAPSYSSAKHLVDPKNLEEVDGKMQPKDALKPFVDAIHRHGMETGFYYGYSWGMPGANNLAAQDVQDLIVRYDPHYFFLDTNVNLNKNSDVRWSIIHSYNDYILTQHNLNASAGDNDLGLFEGPQYFQMPYNEGGAWVTNMSDHTYKYNVEEVWRHPVIKEFDAWSQYHNGMRDDWRMFGKAIVSDIGHGFVTNYDQQVIPERGEKYPQGIKGNNGGKSHLQLYPLSLQQPATMRDDLDNWLRNDKGMDLRESLYGTFPYTFDYEKRGSNWHDDPKLAFKYGEGPEWGYVVSRDQSVYMHMVENQIPGKSKTGYTGQKTIEAGPFDFEVTKVEWMNEGKELTFKPSTGKVDGKYYYTIDLTGVKADPIDTVLKITTANPQRDFKLTSVKLFSSQNKEELNKLQLRAEAYLNNYTSVLAQADLTYTSDNTDVAAVDASGLVTGVSQGKANITVSATYEGVTKTDTYPVAVQADGSIYADLPLIGAVLETDGKEVFDRVGTGHNLPLTLQGRTEKGGGIDIFHASDVTWHCGIADERAQVTETDLSDLFVIEDSQIKFTGTVDEKTDVAVWADVTVDGKTYTTNKTYLWIYPYDNLSAGVEPKASSGQKSAVNVTDGIINSADGTDNSKWTPDASDTDPSLVFDLGVDSQVDHVTVFYNNWFVRYQNAPKAVQLQVSDDGKTWSEPVTNEVGVPVNGTTKYAWEDDCYTYPVNANGRYVKLTFPGGAQGDQLDILEVRVMGPQSEEEEGHYSKKTLEALLEKAKQHVADGDVDGLVESVQKLFAEAIAEGEAVMANENASKQEIFNASLKLMKAIHALGFHAGDKADLEMALELAEMIDLSKYVDAGQEVYLTAKAEAEKIMADGDAMQKEVDEAWRTLVDAMSNLRLKADKAALSDLLDSVKDLDLNKYTEESVKAYNEVLAYAISIMDDETLSVDDQAKVDEAIVKLAAAKEELTEKKDDSNNSGNNENVNNSQTIKTGDTSLLYFPVVGIVLGMGTVILLVAAALRKKRR